MEITLHTVAGPALAEHLPALARLRIAVFREWPYLYDGDEATEAAYLGRYLEAPGAAVVLASGPGGEIVGASTCLPMAEEVEIFREPLRQAGHDPASCFYFGESVLLPAIRGRGLGKGFMAAREVHARSFAGIRAACFCAVERAPDDPRRPAGYRPLDDFWRAQGFAPLPGVRCRLAWREVGHAAETEKALAFWLKRWL